MYIRPELQALRGDDTPQRLAQARQNALIADWRAGPIMANVEAELAHTLRQVHRWTSCRC